MDIASYSADSRGVIKIAKEIAAEFRHPEIMPEHLLLAVIRHEGSEVESILNQLGKSPSFVQSVIEQYLKDQPGRATARENLKMGPMTQQVLANAIEEKAKLYDPLVEPEHIFLALLDPRSQLSGYVREKLEFTREDGYRAMADSKSVEEITTGGKPTEPDTGEAPKKAVSGTLRYCIDMTALAAANEYDPMIGREDEVQQVIQILLRRRKNSPILVGGAGVGKSAIVEGFSQAIIGDKVPKALRDCRVMEVDMGSMVAGAKYKGEFEERFKTLIGDTVKSGGKLVLFIDEVHTITGAGSGSGGMDAANLIKPALARGQLRLIGATTEEEYTKYIEKDKALVRRFEKVKIEEPTFDDAVRIVDGVITKYQDHHKITFSREALIASVKYSKRYLSERNLPDIALDIIDEAGSGYATKEEWAKENIPKLKDQIAELRKQISAFEGKDPEKEAEEFNKLRLAYEGFAEGVERLHDFWGHRLEAAQGA
jgi:ATP-dependent Clp protease ATP-binding subunit ClpA